MKIIFLKTTLFIVPILLTVACQGVVQSSMSPVEPAIKTEPTVKPKNTAPTKSIAKNLHNWKLTLETTGGFGGGGTGNIFIESNGKMIIKEAKVPNQPEMNCETQLPNDLLMDLKQILSTWQLPDAETRAKLGIAYSDAIGYELRLRPAKEKRSYEVKWFDNTAQDLPPSTKKLFETLMFYREMGKKECALDELKKGKK